MDEDRISGTVRNVGGKIEEGVGRLTGDARTQIQGKLDQAAGAAQDLYGQTADAARDTAATFDKWLRRTIETQPYTVAIVGAWDRLAARQNAPTALIGWPWLPGPHGLKRNIRRPRRHFGPCCARRCWSA
jgi:uncharacterized protein YjbJ (UPF0337 family)